MAVSASDADECLLHLESQMRKVGLAYKIEAKARAEMESVGLLLDGRRRTIRNTSQRTWRLYAGVGALIAQGGCTGDTMRVIAGYLVHFLMIRRCVLSAVKEIWRFIEANGERGARFNDELISELKVARALLPVLVHNAWTPAAEVSCIQQQGVFASRRHHD